MDINAITNQVVDELGSSSYDTVQGKDVEAIIRNAQAGSAPAPISAAPAAPVADGGIEAIVQSVVNRLDDKSCGCAAGGGIAGIVNNVVSELGVCDASGIKDNADAIIRHSQSTVAAGTGGAQAAPSAQASGDVSDLPAHMEHALLVPDITAEKIREQCGLARKFCIAAVNVAPYYVPVAAEALRGSTVAVGTSIGIPNAAMSAAAKLADVRDCLSNGAEEIDVALNNLAIKSGKLDDARRELEDILEVARGKAAIKAAFEHCLFDAREKEEVLKMLRTSGVEYVKIQNVLSGQPASAEDIQSALEILGRGVKIKIDGGVKTVQRVRELVNAGASRIGLSATFDILK